MIIYLHGSDAYRRNNKAREIITEYRKKRGSLDFLSVDCEDEEGAWFLTRDFLVQPSMFVDSKFLELKNFSSLTKEELKEATFLVRDYVDSKNIFVLLSDAGIAGKEWGFLREKPVVSQEFSEMERREVEAFIEVEAKKRGVVFDESAMTFFLDYLMEQEERSRLAVNRLEALSLLVSNGRVTLTDLKSLISWRKVEKSFGLATLFLKSKKVEERLIVLERLRLKGDDVYYTLNLLSSLSRNRSDVLGLARADEMVKSGKMDGEGALLEFALGT